MKSAFHEYFPYRGKLRLRAVPFQSLDFLAHWHEDIELLFIISGQQRLGVNRQLLTLSAGHVVLVAPLDIHYYSKCGEVDGFMFIFPAEFIGSSLPAHALHWQIGSSPKLNTLLKLAAQLVHEMKTCEPHYELAAEGLLRLFVASLLRPDPDDICCNLDSADRERILVMQDILAYLDENCREPISRADVAARFHLSIAHFTRTFKMAAGLNFTEYLTQLRLENACRDICQTDLPIAEIALNNGFESVRTFNRAFRRILQKTPSSLR